MSNDYYNYDSALSPQTLARAEAVASELSGIAAGFALLPSRAPLLEGRHTNVGTFGGTATALTASLTTPSGSYQDGMRIQGRAPNAATGTTTINLNTWGVKQVVRPDQTAIQANDWAANDIIDMIYNADDSGGAFVLQTAALGILVAATAQATAAAASATAAAGSASAAASSASAAASSATTSSNWANQTTGAVGGGEFSSKAYAIGGTGVTGAAGAAKEWATSTSGAVDGGTGFSAKELAQGSQASTGGSAKNWAQQTGADVTGAAAQSRSAKSWAQDNLAGVTYGGSAKDWAQSASLPDGVNKSAKSYATDAATSATAAQAALASVPGRVVVFKTVSDSPISIDQTFNGYELRIDTSGGNVVVNLTQIANLTLPFNVIIKKETTDTNTVTINAGGTDLIDSQTSKTISSIGGTFLAPENVTSPKQWTSADYGQLAGNLTYDSGTTAGGSTVTLSVAPGAATNTAIFLGGVRQRPGVDYTVSATTVTFTTTPASGLGWWALTGSTLAIGTPADGTVTNTKMANMANNTMKANVSGGSAAPSDVNLATAGSSLVLIGTYTANNAASLNIPNIFSTTYDSYEIELVNIACVTSSNVNVRITEDGSTYKTTGYSYALGQVTSGGAGALTLGGESQGVIAIGALRNSSSDVLLGTLRFFQPAASNGQLKLAQIDTTMIDASGHVERWWGSGGYVGDVNPINGVQLLMGSGNITATVRVWARRNS